MCRPHRHACLTVGALVLMLCGSATSMHAAGEFRTFDVESLRVTLDSEWASPTAAGYLPVRFDITNLGEDRLIEIAGNGTRVIRSGRAGYSQGNLSVRRSIRLTRGARVRFTMAIPTGGQNEFMRFQLREAGRTLQTFGTSSTFGMFGGPWIGISDLPALLVASGPPYAKFASSWPRPQPVPGGPRTSGIPVTPSGASRPPLDLVLEPARLPTSWLGYTSVQAVAIGPHGWDSLDAAQRSAVLTWTAAGGTLLFVDGALETLFPDARQRPALAPATSKANYLFGHIHLRDSAVIDAEGFDATLQAIQPAAGDPWRLPMHRVPGSGSTGARGFRLPIPGVNEVPARAYLGILIVFSLLIGPVNHIMLRRRRQQSLIVATTPLIALIFIVLLTGYVVAVEGFGVRARAATFTLLDETSNQAATHANVSMYAAGLAPSGGMRFSRDVAVFPTDVTGMVRSGDLHLDVSEAQRFSGGLLDARTPSNFETIEVRSARERLTFRRDGSQLSVANGLGGTISKLRYRRGDTFYTLTGPLAPGAAGPLRQATGVAAEMLPAEAALSHFRYAAADQPDGSYLAVLERSPFWQSGVAGIDERDSFHLVLGFPQAQP